MSPGATEPSQQRRSERDLHRLHATWASPRGFYGWLSTIDHKTIGSWFIITAFAFFLLGGTLALLMRLQLAQPGQAIIGPDRYSQVFSTHGSTMMFLFAVPVMQAIAIYLVPLMIGARDVAFPRLNAFSYWIYLFGGLMLYIALALDSGPETGWFSYVPLAGPDYSFGKRSDVYAQMITFTELSGLVVAVQVIVTVFKLRAPGMSLQRIPVFVWASLVTAFMVMIAMPAIMLGTSILITDRLVSTQFFNPAKGGDVLLWQHLFWFFGHPEVYIIFIPALGIVASIVPTFARRPMFGYPAVVASMILTGLLGFALWVHHMFATHVSQLGQAYFTAMSMMIAIPTGLQIFCWIATLWDGKIVLRTPLLFVIGFFVNFVIGGLTGVMVAAVPFDLQVHDTYFIVAHLHYVLIGGAVFPLFAGFYYWFPKVTGRLLDERAGRWNFWLLMAGTNLTFFPMHELGLIGMPRRVYTYPSGMGWDDLNLLASAGAAIIAMGVAVFIGNVIVALRNGALAGDNPWSAGTLEWATSSPPPPFNFARVPVVRSLEPLWEATDGPRPVVTGLRDDMREVLVTSVLDASPDHRLALPGPSIWPFLSAIAVTGLFVGSIYTPWAIPIGAIPIFVTLTGWFWPKAEDWQKGDAAP